MAGNSLGVTMSRLPDVTMCRSEAWVLCCATDFDPQGLVTEVLAAIDAACRVIADWGPFFRYLRVSSFGNEFRIRRIHCTVSGKISVVAFGDWNHLEPMVHATP